MPVPQPLGFICALQHRTAERGGKKRLIFIQNFEVFSEKNKKKNYHFLLSTVLFHSSEKEKSREGNSPEKINNI